MRILNFMHVWLMLCPDRIDERIKKILDPDFSSFKNVQEQKKKKTFVYLAAVAAENLCELTE